MGTSFAFRPFSVYAFLTSIQARSRVQCPTTNKMKNTHNVNRNCTAPCFPMSAIFCEVGNNFNADWNISQIVETKSISEIINYKQKIQQLFVETYYC